MQIQDTPSGWWLIGLTAGLIVVGAIQIIMFYIQWRAMRDGVNRSAQAAGAATDQAKIAQDTFEKVERPYLYIFGIGRLEIEEIMVEFTGPEDVGFVNYIVANYGKVAGIIEEVFVDLCTSSEVAPLGAPLVNLGHTLMSNRIFPPGHERKVKDYACDGPEYFLREEDGPNVVLKPGEALFCHILVRYRGPFTQGHETSACWKMGPGDNFFVEFGHGDFNYVR
jgi:hypothetical protein